MVAPNLVRLRATIHVQHDQNQGQTHRNKTRMRGAFVRLAQGKWRARCISRRPLSFFKDALAERKYQALAAQTYFHFPRCAMQIHTQTNFEKQPVAGGGSGRLSLSRTLNFWVLRRFGASWMEYFSSPLCTLWRFYCILCIRVLS
jgi:hypothetical protein